MKRTSTTIRCVPRFGYDSTDVRMLDVDVPDSEESSLHEALSTWFTAHGIADAVFAVEMDEDGYFAIVNDEAFSANWGERLL